MLKREKGKNNKSNSEQSLYGADKEEELIRIQQELKSISFAEEKIGFN